MAAFDGAVLDGIQHAGAGYDFAGGEEADLELAARGCSHALGDGFGGPEDGIQGFREA